MKTHNCPECGSERLIVTTETSWFFNTDEFFCHSVKSFDANAKVSCLACDWVGQRKDFEEEESK